MRFIVGFLIVENEEGMFILSKNPLKTLPADLTIVFAIQPSSDSGSRMYEMSA